MNKTKITAEDLCQYCIANEDDIADSFECSISNVEKIIEKIRKSESDLIETLHHILTVYSMAGGDVAETMVKKIIREKIMDIEQECYR